MPRDEFDPEVDDYHQSAASKRLPAISENQAEEAQEREAKRQRMLSGIPPAADDSSLFCYLAVEEPGRLMWEAQRSFFNHEEFYVEHGVDLQSFIFAFKRNDFQAKYEDMYDFAMGATPGTAAGKKKAARRFF